MAGLTALEDDGTQRRRGPRHGLQAHAGPTAPCSRFAARRFPTAVSCRRFTDITKRCEAEAHVTRLASEDPLTGLPNRRVFQFRDRQDEPAEPRRRTTAPTAAEFAVLFLDLDRFKVINDTLGHRVGDMLLIEVAQRLRRVCGLATCWRGLAAMNSPSCCRRSNPAPRLKRWRIRICEAINQPYEIDGHRIRSSVSIGIAIGPHDGDNADDLLMAADLALYAVKASSRGTYRFYERVDERGRQRPPADRNGSCAKRSSAASYELHYQPIIDLRRNVVTGFEALARWKHPVKGMISPGRLHPHRGG